MKISDKKKKMLEWRDFYGGDIFYTDEIQKAKTNKELLEIMDMYYRHLEDVANDAGRHCENFTRSLGLYSY